MMDGLKISSKQKNFLTIMFLNLDGANSSSLACVCLPAVKEGFNYIPFIGSYFGDCIYTPMEILSFSFAYIGTFATLMSTFPQLYCNYTLKSASGLSFGLLLFWAFGDASNLLGGLLTAQLPSQLVTAVLFLMMDFILISQYSYYEKLRPSLVRLGYVSVPTYAPDEEVLIPPQVEDEDDLIPPQIEGEPVIMPPSSSSPTRGPSILGSVFAATSVLPKVADARGYFLIPVVATISTLALDTPPNQRICNALPKISFEFEFIGFLLAWFSGMCYLYSRIPQVVKNYQEKSVHGLSFYLFFLSIVGNFGYGISIILRLPVIDEHFWKATFPYLLGSLGVLFLDMFTLFQAKIYGGF